MRALRCWPHVARLLVAALRRVLGRADMQGASQRQRQVLILLGPRRRLAGFPRLWYILSNGVYVTFERYIASFCAPFSGHSGRRRYLLSSDDASYSLTEAYPKTREWIEAAMERAPCRSGSSAQALGGVRSRLASRLSETTAACGTSLTTCRKSRRASSQRTLAVVGDPLNDT